MLEDNFDHLLPQDDELLRRENLFLKMFDKFSIDEGDDPEPVDLDASDEMVEDDNRSSFSEASSSDADEEDEDSRSVVENIAKQLEPVIQRRVNAWPMKGVHLQLKTVDPSVSVVDWLKANQESTTTTKKYKKVVVNAANKTTITTTKRTTTTTTRKSSFNAIVPRLVAVGKAKNRHRKEADPAIEAATSNDSIVPSTSLKIPEKRKKQKDRKKSPMDAMEEVPEKMNRLESVDFSGSNKAVKGTFAKPKRPTKKQSKAADVETFAKPKRTTKKQFPDVKRTEIESKSERTISNSDATPSDDESKRCLRSRMERNIVQQVREDNHSAIEQAKVKVTKKRNKQPNRTESLPSDRTTVEPSEKKTRSVHRNRSPLKEREVNRNARVNVERMPSVGATTRNGRRMQKNAFEQTADTGANGMDPNSQYEAPTTSTTNQFRIPRTLLKLRGQQQQRIVIHSPNSDTLLGTKIDDTFMLVTKDDYKKHIDAKYLRKTNAWNYSIVPMNRRIVYEPPTIDTIDDSGTDSECEDVLLTSYAYTGRIVQLNL